MSLKVRIDKLEKKCGKGLSLAVICVAPGETAEEAETRHFELHPQEQEAKLVIFVEKGEEQERRGVVSIPMPDSDIMLEIDTGEGKK